MRRDSSTWRHLILLHEMFQGSYVEVLTRKQSNWLKLGATFLKNHGLAAIYLNDLKLSCILHLFFAWKCNSSKAMQRNICLFV